GRLATVPRCVLASSVLWATLGAAPAAFAQGADDLGAPPSRGTPSAPAAAPDPATPASPPDAGAPGPEVVLPQVPESGSATDDEFSEAVPSSEDTSADAGSPAVEPRQAGTPRRVIVIDAAPYGIDEVVGQHVSYRLRTVATEMGYAVMTREDS